MSTQDFTQPIIVRRRAHFWRIQVTNATVISHYGRGNGRDLSSGRPNARRFSSHQHAITWATEALTSKLADGYAHLADFEAQNPSKPATPFSKLKSKQKSHLSLHQSQSTSQSQPTEQCIPNTSTPRRSSRRRAPLPEPVPIPAPSATRQKRKADHDSHNISACKSGPETEVNQQANSMPESDSDPNSKSNLKTDPKPKLQSDSQLQSEPESKSNAAAIPSKRLKGGQDSHAPKTRIVPNPDTPNTVIPHGIVDPASGITGSIYVTKSDWAPEVVKPVHDVMLVLVNVMRLQDKFFVLQLIAADTGGYVLYERWGRTGTPGQSVCTQFPADCLSNARRNFESKFLQKTGLEWERRTDHPIAGKYRYLIQDYGAKYKSVVVQAGQWQYWADDGMDGQPTGWYDYEVLGNRLAEQLFLEFVSNQWLFQRIVYSGMYAFLVDLRSMTQTNMTHISRTTRHIRRIPPGMFSNGTGQENILPSKRHFETQQLVMSVNKSNQQPTTATAIPYPLL